MNFHEKPQDFYEAIQAASQFFRIREVFIEKDYWVSYILKNLSNSPFKNQVVFKGGTALSKAFSYIARFSEDIDLALLSKEDLGDAKRKQLFKEIEAAISQGLSPIDDHPLIVKKGKNRRTFYNYNKVFGNTNFGALKDVIQIELNSFTNPVPYKEIEIRSLLYEFLKAKDFGDEIKKHDLAPVVLNVLSLERTFSEKLLALTRLSYEKTDSLRSKIRHFYDLHMILDNNDILDSETYDIIQLAKKDDESNPIFNGEWLNHYLSEAPLFTNLENIWMELSSTYLRELPQLCWLDQIPGSDQILKSMMKIRTFIIELESM